MNLRDAIELSYGSPLQVLSDCLRGFLIAKPGHDFIACDWSSIESRILAWLAGEEYKLEIYRGHGKIYEFNAAGIYRVPIESITKEDPRRQVGKVAELAFGFGGGKGAWAQMAKNYGIKYNEKDAETFKNGWREINPKTVKFWYNLENAAIAATTNPGRIYSVDKISYKRSGSFLWCRLPSGRVLCYPYPEIQEKPTPWYSVKPTLTYKSEDSQSKKFERVLTYGGSLCENVTQATAADILREGLKNCTRRGYQVVLHVHDEIVAEVPESFGSVKEMEEIMSIVPEWAEGLPLACGGWRGKRFRK